MQSEIKRQLAGHDPKTGEDLDIHVSKKIQIICNLCGIPSCRHIVSLPQEDFPYIVGTAFPQEDCNNLFEHPFASLKTKIKKRIFEYRWLIIAESVTVAFSLGTIIGRHLK